MKYCKDCKYCNGTYSWQQNCIKSETKIVYEDFIYGICKKYNYKKCDVYRITGACGKDAKFFIHKNIFIRLWQWIKNKQPSIDK